MTTLVNARAKVYTNRRSLYGTTPLSCRGEQYLGETINSVGLFCAVMTLVSCVGLYVVLVTVRESVRVRVMVRVTS